MDVLKNLTDAASFVKNKGLDYKNITVVANEMVKIGKGEVANHILANPDDYLAVVDGKPLPEKKSAAQKVKVQKEPEVLAPKPVEPPAPKVEPSK